jgi:hypothetical protein
MKKYWEYVSTVIEIENGIITVQKSRTGDTPFRIDENQLKEYLYRNSVNPSGVNSLLIIEKN